MPRQDFTVNIPRTSTNVYWGGVDPTYTFSDAVHSKEETAGVSRRKPKGWIPPTNYQLYAEKWRRAQGYRNVEGRYWSKTTGCLGGSLFNTLNHFNEILSYSYASNTPLNSSAAVVAARNKFKRYEVDLGVAFGERKATSRQLGDTAIRLAKSVNELRRGHFRNAARQLGIIHDPGKPRGSNWTNHWLQLQYGWKPLLSDVYGSVDALSKREARDWRVTAKSGRKEIQTFDKSDYYWTGSAVWERGVFVRIDATPSNDLTMSLSSLGILNPLNVAWELVPYSFVVDWFLPIGAWLDSLDALLGYTNIWQSVTTYNKTTYVGSGKPTYYDGGMKVTQSWDEWGEFTKIVRTATSGAPLPSFPRLKDPRSLGHMANGLSLLAQAFGRRS
jgi:hypothetical protein